MVSRFRGEGAPTVCGDVRFACGVALSWDRNACGGMRAVSRFRGTGTLAVECVRCRAFVGQERSRVGTCDRVRCCTFVGQERLRCRAFVGLERSQCRAFVWTQCHTFMAKARGLSLQIFQKRRNTHNRELFKHFCLELGLTQMVVFYSFPSPTSVIMRTGHANSPVTYRHLCQKHVTRAHSSVTRYLSHRMSEIWANPSRSSYMTGCMSTSSTQITSTLTS